MPSRSRGVAISTGPCSVRSSLRILPLRRLPVSGLVSCQVTLHLPFQGGIEEVLENLMEGSILTEQRLASLELCLGFCQHLCVLFLCHLIIAYALYNRAELMFIVLAHDTVEMTSSLEEKLCPIFDEIVKNNQEIMALTKQRDELLPLLMNGQASVKSD